MSTQRTSAEIIRTSDLGSVCNVDIDHTHNQLAPNGHVMQEDEGSCAGTWTVRATRSSVKTRAEKFSDDTWEPLLGSDENKIRAYLECRLSELRVRKRNNDKAISRLQIMMDDSLMKDIGDLRSRVMREDRIGPLREYFLEQCSIFERDLQQPKQKSVMESLEPEVKKLKISNNQEPKIGPNRDVNSRETTIEPNRDEVVNRQPHHASSRTLVTSLEHVQEFHETSTGAKSHEISTGANSHETSTGANSYETSTGAKSYETNTGDKSHQTLGSQEILLSSGTALTNEDRVSDNTGQAWVVSGDNGCSQSLATNIQEYTVWDPTVNIQGEAIVAQITTTPEGAIRAKVTMTPEEATKVQGHAQQYSSVSHDNKISQQQPNTSHDNKISQQQPNMSHDDTATQQQPNTSHDNKITQQQPNTSHDNKITQQQPNMSHDDTATQQQPNTSHDNKISQQQPNISHDNKITQKHPNMSHDNKITQQQPNMSHDNKISQQQPNMSHDNKITQQQPNISHDNKISQQQPNISHDNKISQQQPNISHHNKISQQQPNTSHDNKISQQQPDISHDNKITQQQPNMSHDHTATQQQPDISHDNKISQQQPNTSHDNKISKQQPDISHDNKITQQQPNMSHDHTATQQQPDISHDNKISKQQPDISHDNKISKQQPDISHDNKISKQQPDISHDNKISKQQPDISHDNKITQQQPNMSHDHTATQQQPNMSHDHTATQQQPDISHDNKITSMQTDCTALHASSPVHPVSATERVDSSRSETARMLDATTNSRSETARTLDATKSIDDFQSHSSKMAVPTKVDCSSIDLLLMGNCGNGKSATGNSILGENVFQRSASSSVAAASSASSITMGTATISGQVVNVVDGPSINVAGKITPDELEKVTQNIHRALELCRFAFNALVITLKFGNRFTKQETEALRVIKAVLGKDVIREYGVCVITFGDNFEYAVEDAREDGEELTFESWLKGQTGEVTKLLEECGFRCVLFDNMTKDSSKRQKQIDSLINILPKGKRYSQHAFLEAWEGAHQLEQEANLPNFLKQARAEINKIDELIEKAEERKNHDQVVPVLHSKLSQLKDKVYKWTTKSSEIETLKLTLQMLECKLSTKIKGRVQRNIDVNVCVPATPSAPAVTRHSNTTSGRFGKDKDCLPIEDYESNSNTSASSYQNSQATSQQGTWLWVPDYNTAMIAAPYLGTTEVRVQGFNSPENIHNLDVAHGSLGLGESMSSYTFDIMKKRVMNFFNHFSSK